MQEGLHGFDDGRNRADVAAGKARAICHRPDPETNHRPSLQRDRDINGGDRHKRPVNHSGPPHKVKSHDRHLRRKTGAVGIGTDHFGHRDDRLRPQPTSIPHKALDPLDMPKGHSALSHGIRQGQQRMRHAVFFADTARRKA